MFKSFKAFVARLLAPKVIAPIRRPRFRPAVEGLEGRDVPAMFTWLGVASGDTTDARNWYDNDNIVDDQADQTILPGAGDDVVFTQTMNGPLNGVFVEAGAPPLNFSGTYRSVHVDSTVDYTITLGGAVTTGRLDVSGGAIDQAGNDITVDPALDPDNTGYTFAWYGGTINSGTGLANLKILGGTALIDPGGDALDLGSNLIFVGTNAAVTATIYSGEIDFNNGAGMEVDDGCEVEVTAPANPPRPATLTLKGVGVDNADIAVRAGAKMTVVEGDLVATGANPLSLSVEGGTFTLQGDSTATFEGHVPGFQNGPSVRMTSGRIELMNGTTLTAKFGMDMSGGFLATIWNPNLAGMDQRATIDVTNQTLTNSGADVALCQNVATRTSFGLLYVKGNVDWSGGTYRPVVYAPGGDPGFADKWESTGRFTIRNQARLAPGTVNAQGQPNVQDPAVGQQWNVILSETDVVDVQIAPAIPVDGKWNVQYLSDPVRGITTVSIIGKA